MDATLTPLLHLQPLPAGSASRLLRRGCAVAVVVALHVLALNMVSRSSTSALAQPVIRTIYASVINEPTPTPAPAPAPAASAAPTPAPPVAPVVPAPVAVQPVARPKPVAKPHAMQRPAAAVATTAPVTNAPATISTAAAAPVVTPAPAPPPQPKTLTRGVEYVHEPQPEYPDSAREEGHEGTVILRVLVDEHGKPGAVDIVRSSGFGNLDEAGRAAVRGALFKPYLEEGHAVSVYVIVPLRFQLDS
ncbi:energy transducer TonB [Pseudomonas sp. K2I15]|uniref:energy transducer TonB n=1 Tax=unclassified Pseudomonas TaxID=196821 RepID=UPI000B4C22F0|nr:energy transducer TonB [Pseudomonas sp. K2I15]OWP72158.1 energy transducer TonB [Pseudomonas sp. K2I15]